MSKLNKVLAYCDEKTLKDLDEIYKERQKLDVSLQQGLRIFFLWVLVSILYGLEGTWYVVPLVWVASCLTKSVISAACEWHEFEQVKSTCPDIAALYKEYKRTKRR